MPERLSNDGKDEHPNSERYHPHVFVPTEYGATDVRSPRIGLAISPSSDGVKVGSQPVKLQPVPSWSARVQFSAPQPIVLVAQPEPKT